MGTGQGRRSKFRVSGRALIGVAALVSLSACATMRGAPRNALEDPESTLTVKQEGVEKKLFKREEIIQHYIVHETNKKAFRNRVIDHYMGEIDRNYEFYSQRLFNEGIQAALGFDTAIIGLSSTAALFENAANDLATVISAFAGTQGAINKNLYFERTLPALIATMDASRATVEADLVKRKDASDEEYSLEAAIRDLRRYQQAGTLMRAVTKVTERASDEKALAEEDARVAYEKQLGFTCTPDDAVLANRPAVITYWQDLQDKLGSVDATIQAGAERDLRYLSAALGLSVQGSLDEVIEAQSVFFSEKVCTQQQYDSLRDSLRSVYKVKL